MFGRSPWTILVELLAASHEVVADLFGIHKMLEPPLARCAALHAIAADLEAIDQILRRHAEQVQAGQATAEEDRAFRDRTALAAQNRVIVRTIAIPMDLLRESRTRSLRVAGRAERSLEGHRRILEAIRRRDPDGAAAAMQAHIEAIEATLSGTTDPADGSLRSDQQPPARTWWGGLGWDARSGSRLGNTNAQ